MIVYIYTCTSSGSDPCAKKHCHIGHECDLDEEGLPVCVCARKCREETQERAKVCSYELDS